MQKNIDIGNKIYSFLNIAHCSTELSSDGEMDTDSTLFYSLHKDCDGHLYCYWNSYIITDPVLFCAWVLLHHSHVKLI